MRTRLRGAAVTTAVAVGAVTMALLPAGAASAAAPAAETRVSAAATSCGFYSGTALTQRGNTGDRVREIQCLLNKQSGGGDVVVVDGIFGQNTEDWVRSYQHYRGLTSDGLVGVNTWRALRL